VLLDRVAFSRLDDYNGVAFSIELLEWVRHFRKVSKRTRMFVL